MDNQLNQTPSMTPQKKSLAVPLVIGFLVTVCLVLLFVYYRSSQTSPSLPLPAPLPLTSPSPTRMVEKMEEVKGQLIAGMPNVPMYPDATLHESFKRTLGEQYVYTANMTTEASMSDILSFYQTELTNDGWTITAIPENIAKVEDEAGLEASKGDMSLLITLESEDQPTQMAISVFVKK